MHAPFNVFPKIFFSLFCLADLDIRKICHHLRLVGKINPVVFVWDGFSKYITGFNPARNFFRLGNFTNVFFILPIFSLNENMRRFSFRMFMFI